MNAKRLLLLGLSACGMQSFAAGLSYDFESSTTDWYARGTGTTTIELSSAYAHGGSQSLYIDKRSSSWHGAWMQNDYIAAGKTYDFSVYVYTTTAATIDLSMEYTLDGTAQYKSVASKSVSANTWTEISGRITLPEEATGFKPYVQSSTASLSFYIDDFTCEEYSEALVDFSDQPSLKDIFANYFKIGTAVTADEITPQNTKNMVLHHFNSVTPGNELKPDCLLDQTSSIANGNNVNPQIKLPTSTKTVLKFCSDNNIPIRGHVMVWHSQTPDWFFKENFETNGNVVSIDVMNQRMENYIKNVIELVTTTYPNLQIYAWDIVNECFKNGEGVMRDAGSNYTTDGASMWMQVYGDNTFIYNAFTYAKKYIPSGCKVYYNDYNEYIDSKRDGIYNLVKDLYDKNLCDGIGMQSHLSTSYPSVSLYKTALEKYATIGCDIQITELDITLANGATYETQAQMYKDLFDLYRSHKDNISLVAFWGTNDENSWRASGEPLIFASYKPKAAYYSIIDGMPTTEVNNVAAEEAISVAPTATKDLSYINCKGQFSYNVMGVAGQTEISGMGLNSVCIDLSNVPAGIYFIKVIAANGEQKVVKVIKL